jgi:hypothetical protein
MHKPFLIATALVLSLVLPATVLAAPSGTSEKKNPVVDISGLSRAGLWKTTSTITTAGQTHKSTDTECIAEARLEDILNYSEGDVTPTVTDYSLHGNHLHITGTMGQASFDQDVTFDGRDHNHVRTTIKTASGHTIQTTSKGHRVGPCKAGDSERH